MRVVSPKFCATALVLVFALAGCATAPPAGPLPALPAGQSVVLVNQPVSLMNAKWGSLRIRHKTTGKIVTLRNEATSGALYSLFTGAVPTGTYTLAGFDADGVAPLAFGVLPALLIHAMTSDGQRNATIDTFTVQDGQLTNLGLVLSSGGDKPLTIAVADEAALRAAVADLDARSLERVKSMSVRTWDRMPDAAQHAAAEALVRTKTTRLARDFPADGRVLLGTPLGKVQERDPSGRWSTLATGSADNINIVRMLPDGRLLAGSDSARYYLRGQDGTWTSGSLANGGMITAIEPLGNRGVAILTQKFGPGPFPIPVENHLLVAADPARLDEAREVSPAPAAVQGDTSPALFFSGTELLVWVNHAGFARTGDLYRVDPVTLVSRKEETPYWGTGRYRTTNGPLVRERMNGLERYVDFSSDNGRTWVRGENPAPLVSRFTDTERGYGLATISTGWSSITGSLTRTIDGGKTWTNIGETMELAGALAVHTVGDRILVYTGRQMISTADEGKNWRVEWPLAE